MEQTFLLEPALGRKVVGYDLTLQNLQKVRSVALEHTSIHPDDLVLHHSDGCDLKEYEDQQDLFDLISLDPPYASGAERYTDDPRCLGNMRSLDMFYSRLETCLINLKRLIKPSNWEERIFHAIVIKCGKLPDMEKKV